MRGLMGFWESGLESFYDCRLVYMCISLVNRPRLGALCPNSDFCLVLILYFESS